MPINATKKVGELAVEVPRAIPLFEGLGIDYCCGGNRSLEREGRWPGRFNYRVIGRIVPVNPTGTEK